MTSPLLTVRDSRVCGMAQSSQLSAAQERGGWTRRAGSGDQLWHARLPRRQRRRIEATVGCRKEQRPTVGALRSTLSGQAPTLGQHVHGGHAFARRKAPCRTHGVSRRRGVPRLLFPQRGAAGIVPRHQRHAVHRGARVQPNPSLKRSANGRPPGPGSRYGVHFLLPGPGVLPLSPA